MNCLYTYLITEHFSFLIINMNNLTQKQFTVSLLLISSAFYRGFRNSEVDYRIGGMYISASNRWKHKYSSWDSTGHATTKKWKCSVTQVRIGLWIFLSLCKDVPWPEQRCQMKYLGFTRKIDSLSYCVSAFFLHSPNIASLHLTLPLHLPTSTYFLPPLTPLLLLGW